MSEATAAFDAANGLDLDLDLASVDTSYPSLPAGKVEMRIVKCEVKPWNSDPDKKSLVVSLETTALTTGTKGEELAPGFRQTYRLNLQQGYNNNGEAVGDFKKDIAKFLDACKAGRQFNGDTIASLPGTVVTAVLKKRKDPSDGYGETEVKYLEATA